MVGFDDVEYAVMGHPRLTTVRQPCYELGRTAGELLLTQIQGGPRGRAVYLPTPSLSGILRHGVPLDHKGNGSQYLRRKQA